MVKVETVGMYDVAKINPTLSLNRDIKNHSFITIDNILYLIDNTLAGDNSYRDDVILKAGEKLNGYIVGAWEGQNLIVDAKHVVDDIDDLDVGDTLTVNNDKLKSVEEVSGVYFEVVGKTKLTENAVVVKVCVYPNDVNNG